MTILYCCLARGPTILAEHTISSTSFQDLANSMLKNIPTKENKKTTYTSDNYLFHVIVENGIIYMCATEKKFPRAQAFRYLQEIVRHISHDTEVGPQVQFAGSHELEGSVNHVMATEMEKYSHVKQDSVTVLQSQVDEVKDVMTQNIDKVLERGDKIDTLISKTEDLEANAQTFQKTAKRVKNQMWWKNTRNMIILVIVVLVVITVLVLIILGATGVI
ncbi:vesicle-associated membrane protein 7-like [Ptychodera flava]|uniref:vesicle-associated membrane protein 7-like n=1 Tax=Ptychodera flava TaxID=63121 RepID=UPI003969E814